MAPGQVGGWRRAPLTDLGRYRRKLTGERAQLALPHPLLRPLKGGEESIVGKRLQDVIDRIHVECLGCIAVERSHKYNHRAVRRCRLLTSPDRWRRASRCRGMRCPIARATAFRAQRARPHTRERFRYRCRASAASRPSPGQAARPRRPARETWSCGPGDRKRGLGDAGPGSVSSTIAPPAAFGRTVRVAAWPVPAVRGATACCEGPCPHLDSGQIQVVGRRRHPTPQPQFVPTLGRANHQVTGPRLRRKAVAQGVFDQRLQQQGRNGDPFARGVDLIRHVQSIAKAYPLQLDVNSVRSRASHDRAG